MSGHGAGASVLADTVTGAKLAPKRQAQPATSIRSQPSGESRGSVAKEVKPRAVGDEGHHSPGVRASRAMQIESGHLCDRAQAE